MQLDRNRLVDLIENCGFDSQSYSGRGMYGRECVALTHGDDTLQVLAQLVENADDLEEAAEIVREAKTDQMGRGEVIYWPRVKWGEDEAT